MNLILLFDDDFVLGSPDRVRLTGRRQEHLLNIQKIEAGQTLRVGRAQGLIGEGIVRSIEAGAVELDVKLTTPPPQPLPVHLVIALPRPQVVKRVIEFAVSMGVKRITLLGTQRVEKSYWLSPVLKEERLFEHVLLGLEQGKDTVLPEILREPRFKPFVEDRLPRLAQGTLPLVLHPESAVECPRPAPKPVTLVIGPEGGLIPYEIEALQKIHFKAVHIGARILRVEAAVAAALGRLF